MLQALARWGSAFHLPILVDVCDADGFVIAGVLNSRTVDGMLATIGLVGPSSSAFMAIAHRVVSSVRKIDAEILEDQHAGV